MPVSLFLLRLDARMRGGEFPITRLIGARAPVIYSTIPALRCSQGLSLYPPQHLLQVRKELRPPVLGALVGLLLIRPEARLLHAQARPRAGRGESPGDDTLETIGRPRVRQRLVRLDGQDATVDGAPVRAKIETVP